MRKLLIYLIFCLVFQLICVEQLLAAQCAVNQTCYKSDEFNYGSGWYCYQDEALEGECAECLINVAVANAIINGSGGFGYDAYTCPWECIAGYYSSDSSTQPSSCTACPIGSYKAAGNVEECTLCSAHATDSTAGRTTDSTGSTAETDCKFCANSTSNSGKIHSWVVPKWETPDIAGLCRIDSCKAGFWPSPNNTSNDNSCEDCPMAAVVEGTVAGYENTLIGDPKSAGNDGIMQESECQFDYGSATPENTAYYYKDTGGYKRPDSGTTCSFNSANDYTNNCDMRYFACVAGQRLSNTNQNNDCNTSCGGDDTSHAYYCPEGTNTTTGTQCPMTGGGAHGAKVPAKAETDCYQTCTLNMSDCHGDGGTSGNCEVTDNGKTDPSDLNTSNTYNAFYNSGSYPTCSFTIKCNDGGYVPSGSPGPSPECIECINIGAEYADTWGDGCIITKCKTDDGGYYIDGTGTGNACKPCPPPNTNNWPMPDSGAVTESTGGPGTGSCYIKSDTKGTLVPNVCTYNGSAYVCTGGIAAGCRAEDSKRYIGCERIDSDSSGTKSPGWDLIGRHGETKGSANNDCGTACCKCRYVDADDNIKGKVCDTVGCVDVVNTIQ